VKKLYTVFRHEYLAKVRTRAFVLGTFLVPVVMAVFVVLPAVFLGMKVGKPMTVAVVDESGQVLAPLSEKLTETNKQGQKLYTLVEEAPAGRDSLRIVKDLGPRVARGEIGGFLVIPRDVLTGGNVAFYAENVSDFRQNRSLEQAIGQAVREARILQSNLDRTVVDALLKEVNLNTFKVGEGGTARKDQGSTFGVAYIMSFLFYFVLIFYSAMMLRAALEEKTSRSAELMIATVRSSHLMGGKILGIGTAALTQLGVWVAVFAIFSAYGSATGMTIFGGTAVADLGVTPFVLFAFLLYFILGFLLYAAVFGAVGSMVNSDAEAQTLQFPVTMPMLLAFYLMFLAIRDPNGTLIRICSWFPLFSPILMMVRICVLRPPVWEIALSLVLLVAAIGGAIWVAGRIFRVGLLMYGKRPDLPELMKWIRYD
jgi:ABC-2 type transport system permease protein